MFLAGSWFQWGPPNLPEVSSVSCLCSCSRTFYFTVTPLVILPTIPAPGDLCHFWHVSWLLLLIKQEEILSYFWHSEIMWNSISIMSFYWCIVILLHSRVFKGWFYISAAELSNQKVAWPTSGLCVHFLKFADPYSVPFFTPILYNHIELATFLQWFPVQLNTILAS